MAAHAGAAAVSTDYRCSEWSGALDDLHDREPCDHEGICQVCVLLTAPLAGESRVQWAKRVLGLTETERVAS